MPYNDPLSSINPWQIYYEQPTLHTPDDVEDFISHALFRAISFFGAFLMAVFILVVITLLASCSTSKNVEQHHHHTYEADTLAVKALVDSRLSVWQKQIDSSWSKKLSLFGKNLYQSSQEQEVTTEMITVSIDSIGREIRTEQRRTERTLSQQQQQQERRIAQEFEKNIKSAIAHQDSIWQQRYEALQKRVEQTDSISNIKVPAKQLSSWQQARILLGNVMLIALSLYAIVWIIRKRVWWLRFFK